MEELLGWNSRGYLPHFDAGAVTQSITIRLDDTFPQHILQQWKTELHLLPQDKAQLQRIRLVEEYLDRGLGKTWLHDPRIAALVEDALLFFDDDRYYLHAWVVMPNHAHVLFTPIAEYPLRALLRSWKGFTARMANRLLERTGAFWQEDYFDRFIRNEAHFNNVVDYIEQNPVKAGLFAKPEEWRWSSAYWKAHTGSANLQANAGSAGFQARP